MSDSKTVNLTQLRTPFPPEFVGKLPRVTCRACSENRCSDHKKVKCEGCGNWISERHIHLDYVGHADVTSRLLEVDPEWEWEPNEREIDKDVLAAALATGDGQVIRQVMRSFPPRFDADKNGNPVGLWIRLTVGGVTRLGYGSCPSNQNDAVKVLIGDALRNAAMRFGVALDLWAKGDRADPTAENATASAGQAARGNAGSPQRQNGNGQRGQVSRPAQQQAPAKPAEDIDLDAQAFADEASACLSLTELEGITRRARQAAKLAKFVRNPSSGGSGKLAIYLDWKRKQLKEADDALAELNTAAAEAGVSAADLDAHVRLVTRNEADLESATAAQLRQAVQALREMKKAAAA